MVEVHEVLLRVYRLGLLESERIVEVFDHGYSVDADDCILHGSWAHTLHEAVVATMRMA